MAYDLAPWHDFFVMLGGASAALAGLVFVGLSIHARTIARHAGPRRRARSLTFGIVYVTMASGLALMPGMGRTPLGIVLLLGCLAIAAVFAHPLRQSSGLQALTIGLAVANVLVGAYGAASLVVGAGGGLYVLGATALVGVFLNVFGAFSLLLGLAHD